eukprot:350355-Chlamydomonas_euryale.AAC.2
MVEWVWWGEAGGRASGMREQRLVLPYHLIQGQPPGAIARACALRDSPPRMHTVNVAVKLAFPDAMTSTCCARSQPLLRAT